MKSKSVIISYSFGSRKNGRCKSNIELAKFTEDLHEKTRAPVIAQHEIAECLKSKPLFVVKRHRIKSNYLGSEEVTAQAVYFIRKKGFSSVLLVAQPFLHRHKCKKILESYGLRIIAPKCPRYLSTGNLISGGQGVRKVLLYMRSCRNLQGDEGCSAD